MSLPVLAVGRLDMEQLKQIAVRLADEGVPVRAIARATNTPSGELRETLADARAQGQLIELPREDWPIGFPRDLRALQLARMARQDRVGLALAVARAFGLTTTETGLLLTMLQHGRLSKHTLRYNTRGNTRGGSCSASVDVHVCHLRRRLHPHGIAIETLWGHGYQISPQDRRKAFDLILTRSPASKTRVSRETPARSLAC